MFAHAFVHIIREVLVCAGSVAGDACGPAAGQVMTRRRAGFLSWLRTWPTRPHCLRQRSVGNILLRG